MHALTRLLRPTALGGLLSLLFGVTLIVGGVSGQDAGGLVPVPDRECGAIIVVGNVVPCPTGSITVTKVVTGDLPVPAEGFLVALSSTNCKLPDGAAQPRTVRPGEPGTWTGLFQYAGAVSSPDKAPCSYVLTEAAVPGFTATFSPAGPLQLPQGSESAIEVTLTNASAVTSSAEPAPTLTGTQTAPPPTTALPTAPAASVAPSTSAPALASTGTSNTAPQIVIGAALCVLGVVLIAGTRNRRSTHS